MEIPYIRGTVSHQAHVGVPDGTVEEEFAREGFFGKYAHLYRSKPPTAWSKIEGNLRPRAFDPKPLEGSDFLLGRSPILHNDDVSLSLFSLNAPMVFHFRNADADELYFLHAGTGTIETDFGPVQYESGDYILIPRGTVYRILPKTGSTFLLTEGRGEIRFPDRGMLGQHALFDPAVLRVPTPNPQAPIEDGKEHELKVLREGEISSVYYPFNPITTVGWKGTLSVVQLNMRDIRPVSSDRYHLPPSAHTTFVGKGFVVCSFLPRPLENGDPLAVKVPFYHSNIDYDEVLFYHDGEFFSRAGMRPGMLTFHPQGIHHGPQPQAIGRTQNITHTREMAVMIDTKRPLHLGPRANGTEVKDYWKSWGAK